MTTRKHVLTEGMIEAHSTHMVARTRILQSIHNALRRLSFERHEPFRVHPKVKEQTFVRLGPKKVEAVNGLLVTNVAHQLEATIVMGEMLETDQPIAIEVTYMELVHFVGYVRQLDDMYRKQVDKITRLESDAKRLREKLGTGLPPVGER